MRRPLILLTATALLAGCALGDRPEAPVVPVPAQWNGADAEGEWPSAHWWKGFGSPELDRLIAAAEANNQDIAAAMARVEQADAQARIAGAALLPTLALEPLGSTTRNLSNTGRLRRYSTVAGTFNASYEIDLWGRQRDARDAARTVAEASAYALAVTRLTIVTGIATTYFNLLAVQDQITYAAADADAAQRILDGMIVQQRHGVVKGIEVVRQRTIALELAAELPALEARRTHLVNALAILTGSLPQGFAVDGGSLATLTPPEVPVGLPSELLVHRPDVQEAERQLAAADANISVARKSFLPSFSLNASGGGESLAEMSMITNPTAIFNIGLNMLQPIFEGGRLRGQLDLANARYRELAANYLKAIQQAYGDTEDALATERGTRLQVERQRLATDSAEEALRMARHNRRAGTTDSLSLLAAEQVAIRAHQQDSEAALARALGLVDLYKALGGGWSDARQAQRR